MKLQITPKGLRLRLSQQEYAGLNPENGLSLSCEGWTFRLETGTETSLAGWPARPCLKLGERDLRDLALEPENGLVLPTVPRCEIDVDNQRGK